MLLSLLVYGVGTGWAWIRDAACDSRQRSLLHDFTLYLWAEPGFMLPVDESDKAANDVNRDCLATTNPDVVRGAMQEFAKQSGCKNELTGNPDFPIESLIPTRQGVFMAGPYLYIGTDQEGNPIRLGSSLGSPNTWRVLLVDTRPLSHGQYLFVTNDGSIWETGRRNVVDSNGIIHQKFRNTTDHH